MRGTYSQCWGPQRRAGEGQHRVDNDAGSVKREFFVRSLTHKGTSAAGVRGVERHGCQIRVFAIQLVRTSIERVEHFLHLRTKLGVISHGAVCLIAADRMRQRGEVIRRKLTTADIL
jgi:hypothetical protein